MKRFLFFETIFKIDLPIDPVEPRIAIFSSLKIWINVKWEYNIYMEKKSIPSILSKIPPWPGIIFPVSFILDFLLK